MPDWIAQWVPSITVAAVMSAIYAFFKYVTKSGVERSIQLVFDRKLEETKADIRAREKELEHKLQSATEQIADLKLGVLQSGRSRREAMDTKRLEAAQQLWSVVIDNRRALFAATMTGTMNVQELMRRASQMDEEAHKVRAFAASLLGTFEVKDFGQGAEKHRLFVSPLVWANYRAYTTALLYPVLLLTVVKLGAEPDVIQSADKILDRLKEMIPHQADNIASRGLACLPEIIGELENEIFKGLLAYLEDDSLDAAQMAKASRLLALADTLQRDISASQTQVQKPA